MGYGWFNSKHSWSGGSGDAPTFYDYGWPSGGSSESNVVCQWILDESSPNNIVDEVNSISLTPANAPTYGITVGGAWASLSPGINMVHATWQGFRNASAQAAMAIGTSDFVMECVGELDSDEYPKAAFEDNNAYGWYWRVRNTTNTNAQLFLEADDDTFVTCNFAYPGASPVGDSELHKWRASGDRAGNAEMFYDGTSLGTASLATLSGKNIPSQRPSLGMRYNTDYPFGGTMYEFRMTVGNATNNSGGPGGG